MRRIIHAIAAITLSLTFCCAPAPAEEPVAGRSVQLVQRGGLPKGSYQQSCTCQVSGGTTLLCFCANLQGRMFETDLDVRSCPLPKDIKNCNGRLTCVDPKTASDC